MLSPRGSPQGVRCFAQWVLERIPAGRLDGEIPPHGTLGRNRQHIPADKAVGAVPPEDENHAPPWITITEGAG